MTSAVIGRDVQTTGLAPTDDGFTVVVPASEDADQDGPAVIGDPHMGFQGLRQFGSKFMNHFQLKYRSNLKLDNVMIVDSPGMVDRAVSGDRDTAYMDPSQYGKPTERGYNFPSVVRWFAERADVVIVAFDPQKPGKVYIAFVSLEMPFFLDYRLYCTINGMQVPPGKR